MPLAEISSSRAIGASVSDPGTLTDTSCEHSHQSFSAGGSVESWGTMRPDGPTRASQNERAVDFHSYLSLSGWKRYFKMHHRARKPSFIPIFFPSAYVRP